jgi:hypothetical protein
MSYEDYIRLMKVWEERRKKAKEEIIKILKTVNPYDVPSLLREVLDEYKKRKWQ